MAIVSPSILSSNFAYLQKDIEMLNESEADWFQRDKSTISRHIKNIFSEGELFPDSVVANFATTAADKDFLDNIKSLPTK